MTTLAECNDDEVGGIQLCPDGVYAGMPFTNPEDCERDQVEGTIIHRDTAVKGAVLPFTGASNSVTWFIGLGLGLMALGILVLMILRSRVRAQIHAYHEIQASVRDRVVNDL